ncbi:MAG TPA: response regulator, partial [Spirochaetota bacterium]|nr:response regulator [Spirochaetota bacterium]HPJ44252.1 response regulator [Spirochaetota bacterium]
MNNYAGKTILLVEDEPVILLIQSSILKKNGFNVISAISGKEAIELVRGEENIDLVLMDIDLGKGMDGTETAGVILKERDIPVLFLSSHTEPEIVEKTEGITSYGYVVKNSGDTVLLASIKMAFRLHDERMIVKRQSEKLQSLNEELEATNEELNAAFEELEAAN